MKEVLAYIETKKQDFAELQLFEYMRDTSIEPRKRLAWVPYVSPLAMGFGDLWKYIFRKEPSTDTIQIMLNKHTYEDENHWKWFPKDIKALGFNKSFDFSDSIEFIWGNETREARLLCLQIAILTYNLEPEILLVAIEALEATANIVFNTTASVVNELKKETNKNYPYFGNLHLVEDSTHSMFEKEKKEFVDSIELTHKQQNESFELIDKIFDLFAECLNKVMKNTLDSQKGKTKKPELEISSKSDNTVALF